MRAALISLPLTAIPLVALTAGALAADLPRRAAPPVPVAPLFTWTGFYSGLFAGYGTLDQRTSPLCFDPAGTANGLGCPLRSSRKLGAEDFIAGSEVGYNYQFTPGSGVVVGAAADYQFTRLRKYGVQEGDFPVAGVGGVAYPFSTYHVGQRLDSLGTVRGKIGYAFDRFLVYGTGGLAYGNVRLDTTTTVSLLQFSDVQWDGRKGDWRTGYVAGGGIEYAFSNRLSAKVEGLYYDLGSSRVTAPGTDFYGGLTGAGAYRVGARASTDGFLMRAGINYRFGEGLPFFSIFSELTRPTPYVAAAPSTWDFETGVRYFYSEGSQRYTLGDPFVSRQTNSRLTYRDFAAHSGESFARLDHNPTGLFLKGFLGSGWVTDGRLNDEDFPPALTPYSNTLSSIRSGDIAYAAIDAGYNVFRGDTYRLGVFAGYQYFSELANGFGCRQVAGGDICPTGDTISNRVSVLSEDAHWHALRVGVAGEVRFDRFKVAVEGAYLPVVEMNAYDRHWLRPDINPLPQHGSGDGYFAQGLISYDLTPTVSVGVGGRYWKMEADHGRTKFPFVPGSPTKFETDRFGGFAQISYKILDFGMTPLITK